MIRPLTLLACAALIVTLACSNPPLQVSHIQVGRAVNEDGTVAKFTTTFNPNDTIYVSVATTDLGSGTIAVKWSYGDRVIGESAKPVSYKIAAATEFHLQSPRGFPPGRYSVDVLLDGKPVGTRPFTVEK